MSASIPPKAAAEVAVAAWVPPDSAAFFDDPHAETVITKPTVTIAASARWIPGELIKTP